MSDVRLYDYWRSSASYRVRIALGLAALDWDSLPVDLMNGANRDDAHMKRNPQGLVPVLEIDEVSLTQSLAIVEYLDETRALGLLPTSAVERAQVRALSYGIAMEIHPVCNLRVAGFAVGHSGGTLSMQGWMQEFVTHGLTAFEAMLGQGRYCFGDRITLADLCLMPQLYNARRWGIDLGPMPKICAIEAELAKIPAFERAHPDRWGGRSFNDHVP